jgi:hypothetical protein
MANKTKLIACKKPQPAEQVAYDSKPAVCDRRPGHKGPHRHHKMRARW